MVRIRDLASWAKTAGSRSPAIIVAIIARPDTPPKMSLATTESLMQASSRSFFHAVLLRGTHRDEVGAVAGQIA